MILIDNYDSFTYNIVQYLQELGVTPRVFKNDEVTIEELKNIDFNSVIISPGPGNPCDKSSTGVCEDIVKEFYTTKKILGVCLGHQLIASLFGARIVKGSHIMARHQKFILSVSPSCLKIFQTVLKQHAIIRSRPLICLIALYRLLIRMIKSLWR